jgi:hypothetical protein
MKNNESFAVGILRNAIAFITVYLGICAITYVASIKGVPSILTFCIVLCHTAVSLAVSLAYFDIDNCISTELEYLRFRHRRLMCRAQARWTADDIRHLASLEERIASREAWLCPMPTDHRS